VFSRVRGVAPAIFRRINERVLTRQFAAGPRKAASLEADVAVPEGFQLKRLKLTAEITVSKLFPGGFAWQTMGTLAGTVGYDSKSLGFAMFTGVGDFLGVGFGHMIYKLIQRRLALTANANIHDPASKWVVPDIATEAQTALWLGSAALCSGTLWQPMVNLFSLLGAGFWPVFFGTGAMCSLFFFAGLRVGRQIFHRRLPAIARPSYDNLQADSYLSVSIGGASAFFVGTDFGTLTGNIFQNLFGVTPLDTAFVGSVRAGASTAAGFAAVQTIQNLTKVEGRNYLDDTFPVSQSALLKA